MPPDHQKFLEWNGDRFRKWAEHIGINTYKVVDAILTSRRVEQQTYKGCMGLLKLSERYSPNQLEAACAKALSFTSTPSYKSVLNILKAKPDLAEPEEQSSEPTVNPYGITRGADYYNRR